MSLLRINHKRIYEVTQKVKQGETSYLPTLTIEKHLVISLSSVEISVRLKKEVLGLVLTDNEKHSYIHSHTPSVRLHCNPPHGCIVFRAGGTISLANFEDAKHLIKLHKKYSSHPGHSINVHREESQCHERLL